MRHPRMNFIGQPIDEKASPYSTHIRLRFTKEQHRVRRYARWRIKCCAKKHDLAGQKFFVRTNSLMGRGLTTTRDILLTIFKDQPVRAAGWLLKCKPARRNLR